MVSLGKGQGEIARKQIMDSINAGAWILLQNCHLAASWLKTLEEIVEQIPQERKNKLLNENFRLWLTAMSTDAFPVSLLQVYTCFFFLAFSSSFNRMESK